MMGFRSSCGVFACLLMLGAAAAVAAEEPGPALVDRVGTLELDRALDARGNLGGVTVDRLGFVYVANFRDAVWRIAPEGGVTELSRALYGSSGNAVDARGDLYQANFLADTIVRIGRDGALEVVVDRGLDGPVGLAFGPDGVLYVCNCKGNFLARVDPDGTVAKLAEGPRFACPNGITLGGDGHLYVTNFNHHDILRVSTDGAVETFATLPGGAGNAHIAFSKGFFYVTKIIANRVVKISAGGEVFPLAGSGQPGHEDGPGPEATFFRPNGIAVSPQGDRLYVNTMVGAYSQPEPSRLTIRTIDLVTLGGVLEQAMVAGGLEAAAAAYAAFKADPVRGRENTVAEMIALGYRFLSDRRVPEALRLFALNAESYPEVPAAQFHLGEAYRYVGRTEEAAARYRRVLALDPEDAAAASRLEQLGAAGAPGG